MFLETADMTRLLFQVLAGLILLAGATIDLYLCVRVQTRRLVPSLRAYTRLTQCPFTVFHASLVLFATLLFALPAFFQPPASGTPKESALILSPLLYAVMGLLVTTLCLTYSNASVRQVFFSPSCTARRALGKGLFYGLAVIPPVVLLSMAITTITEMLGVEPHLQEVFDWLGDGSLTLGTRMFMMAAAVVIAPVAEELLFRGILFTAVLKSRSFFPAALLVGLYFALVHFHALSFLPLLALSIAFSAGYGATGSILTPIAMHALFNLTSVFFYLADR